MFSVAREPAREPPPSRAEPDFLARKISKPSRARLVHLPSRTEPSRALFQPYQYSALILLLPPVTTDGHAQGTKPTRPHVPARTSRAWITKPAALHRRVYLRPPGNSKTGGAATPTPKSGRAAASKLLVEIRHRCHWIATVPWADTSRGHQSKAWDEQ